MEKNLTAKCIIIAILILLTSTTGAAIADGPSKLEITNLSGTIFNFTPEQLLSMPKTAAYVDLYCEGILATSGNWSGIPLSYLLTQAQITPEVISIQFIALDAYKVAIPIDLAQQPQIMIAYEKDDKPLAEGLRLIIPGANGATWIAMITSITMSPAEANYPQPAIVGEGKIASLASLLNSKAPNSTSQQEETTPSQPTPPQPTTAQNSKNNQLTTPTNATSPNQQTPLSQTSTNNNVINMKTGVLAIAFGSITALSLAGYLIYKRKRIP